MNPSEYARMREVEDRHWWYQGLRKLVWDTWTSTPHDEARPLLDIGCGTGGTIAGAPGPAVGVDRSPDALRLSFVRGQRRLAQSDAAHLPFADNSFSGALLLDVLYHRAVADPAAVIREARRVVLPGAPIIVNVPAYEWLRSSHDHAIHTERRFTGPRLRELFSAAELDVLRITYWNTLLFPAAASVRLLRRTGTRTESDLAEYREGASTSIASRILRVERSLLALSDLPFGLSILGVAQRPA